MSKFKKGDRVVLIELCDNTQEWDKVSLGSVGVVIKVDDSPKYRNEVVFENENQDALCDHKLEFESVYNSPLYQALL